MNVSARSQIINATRRLSKRKANMSYMVNDSDSDIKNRARYQAEIPVHTTMLLFRPDFDLPDYECSISSTSSETETTPKKSSIKRSVNLYWLFSSSP